jgi:hypothetical protein
LLQTIRQLGERLLRLKGIVDFGDGPVIVESVFGRVSDRPCGTAKPRFGLTAIGWKISGDALSAALTPVFGAAPPGLVGLSLPGSS